MNVRILKKTSNELKMEVEGVGHTFCNLLQNKLLEDENVDFAGYDIPHPLASNPIIYVRTKGNVKPEEALSDAIKRASELNRQFGEEFAKVIKEK
ncbi:MAG: DNA-directed RNA polymerase subunit L [Candidatus Bathyarchaeia archaeon]